MAEASVVGQELVLSNDASMTEIYLFASKYIRKIVHHRYEEIGNDVVTGWIARILENNNLKDFDSSKSSLKTWVINGLRSEYFNLLKTEKVHRSLKVRSNQPDFVFDQRIASSVQEEAREQVEEIVEGIGNKSFKGSSFQAWNEYASQETFYPDYKSVLRLLAMGYEESELCEKFQVNQPELRRVLGKIRTRAKVFREFSAEVMN